MLPRFRLRWGMRGHFRVALSMRAAASSRSRALLRAAVAMTLASVACSLRRWAMVDGAGGGWVGMSLITLVNGEFSAALTSF